MGFHEDFDQAARIAMREMIGMLETHCGLEFHDAYRLCSLAADLRITQFVNGNRGVHAMLARQVLEKLHKRPAFLDG